MPVARYLEHSGGQDNQVNEFLMRPNELMKAKNSTLETVGVVQKMLGYQIRGERIFTESAVDVTGLAGYTHSNGTKGLVATVNGKYLIWDGSTWNDFADAMSTGIYQNDFADPINNEPVYFEQFMDYLFSVGGPALSAFVSYPTASSYVYTQASVTAGAPKARYIKRWKDRLYTADYDKRSRVNQSDVPQNKDGAQPLTWGWATGTNMSTASGSPTVTASGQKFVDYNIKPGDLVRIGSGTKVDYFVKTVDSNTQLTLTENVSFTSSGNATFEVGSNWFPVAEDDGDVITGFDENSNRLLIFKAFSLHRYDGSEVIKVAEEGAVSQRTIQTINQITIFANRKGLYAYDGVQTQLISRKMQKWFDAIPEDELENMVSWKKGNTYNIFIGDVTVDLGEGPESFRNVVITFDTTQNNFCFAEFAHKVKVTAQFVEDNEQSYFFGTDNSEVFNLYKGTTFSYLDYSGEDPVAVEEIVQWDVKTRALDYDAPEELKVTNRIVVFSKDPGGAIFMVSADGKPFETLNRLRKETETIDCNVIARRVRFMLQHANKNNRPSLEGFCCYWERAGRKK